MRHRLVKAAILAVLVLPVPVVLTSLPAAACSEPGSFFEDLTLEEVDQAKVVAVGQAEVVARTGWTWRWHRAGVVAFTQAWPLREDAASVTETVWTINDGRATGGDCYFGRDAGPVGAQQGVHILFEDGSVAQLTALGEGSFGPVDPADLTTRYGEPVTVAPDPGLVEAALAPLVAERRATNALVRGAVVLVVGAFVFFGVRRRAKARTAPAA
jgi:hypothetical protein